MLPVGEWGRELAGWDELLEMSLHAEHEGLDSVWVADHLLSGRGDEEPRAIHECWTLVSALAATTERLELGTLVLCSSFRSPGLHAKMAVEADHISKGRLILGLGAGWYDCEYEAFGYPTDHRVSRFAEALEIIRRLLDGERVSYSGRYYALADAVLLPSPERRIPILIGAHGPRTMRLTARWADAWNTAWFGAPDDALQARIAGFETALEQEQRATAEVERTVGLVVENESSAELAARLQAYDELGFERAIVLLDPSTSEAIDRLAEAARISRG
jgi:probable F420-dependent oxidoreductase